MQRDLAWSAEKKMASSSGTPAQTCLKCWHEGVEELERSENLSVPKSVLPVALFVASASTRRQTPGLCQRHDTAPIDSEQLLERSVDTVGSCLDKVCNLFPQLHHDIRLLHHARDTVRLLADHASLPDTLLCSCCSALSAALNAPQFWSQAVELPPKLLEMCRNCLARAPDDEDDDPVVESLALLTRMVIQDELAVSLCEESLIETLLATARTRAPSRQAAGLEAMAALMRQRPLGYGRKLVAAMPGLHEAKNHPWLCAVRYMFACDTQATSMTHVLTLEAWWPRARRAGFFAEHWEHTPVTWRANTSAQGWPRISKSDIRLVLSGVHIPALCNMAFDAWEEVCAVVPTPLQLQRDVTLVKVPQTSGGTAAVQHHDVDATTQTRPIKRRRVQDQEVIGPPGRETDATECMSAFSNGFTISIRAMERRLGPVAALCHELQRTFGQVVVANLYYTPAAQQGLPLHYDDHWYDDVVGVPPILCCSLFDRSVFVLQLVGRKLWRTAAGVDGATLPVLYEPRQRPDPAALGQMLTFDLQPGDVLYVPRGCAHQALADAGSASLHITIGVEVEACYTWEGLLLVAMNSTVRHLMSLVAPGSALCPLDQSCTDTTHAGCRLLRGTVSGLQALGTKSGETTCSCARQCRARRLLRSACLETSLTVDRLSTILGAVRPCLVRYVSSHACQDEFDADWLSLVPHVDFKGAIAGAAVQRTVLQSFTQHDWDWPSLVEGLFAAAQHNAVQIISGFRTFRSAHFRVREQIGRFFVALSHNQMAVEAAGHQDHAITMPP